MTEERFVIRVVNENQRYIATSEYFPDCIGVADTEKAAVRKLKNIIMEKIKKDLKLGVKVLCFSDVEKVKAEDLFKEKIKVFDDFLSSMAYPSFNNMRSDHIILNPDVHFNLINSSLYENPVPLKPGATPYFITPLGSVEENMGYVVNLQINLN